MTLALVFLGDQVGKLLTKLILLFLDFLFFGVELSSLLA
jgi:hypothetical protein